MPRKQEQSHSHVRSIMVWLELSLSLSLGNLLFGETCRHPSVRCMYARWFAGSSNAYFTYLPDGRECLFDVTFPSGNYSGEKMSIT